MSQSDSENCDSSDEDYVPNEKDNEVLSAEESDGDCAAEDEVDVDNIQSNGKRRRDTVGKSKKRRKTEVDPDSNKTEEKKKEEDDDVWASFMKDTGFVPKSSVNEQPQCSKPAVKPPVKTTPTEEPKAKEEKVKVTEIFEFAGEEVRVDKEVDAKSIARSSRPTPGGGLGNVLKQLGKKNKISTLEKTKLDWDRFKKEENLDEELQTHNKGKDGYLERQDFLQRADLRRFEIEKQLRNVERSKRLN